MTNTNKTEEFQEKNSEIEALETRIVALEGELVTAGEVRMRALADLENFRRREEENRKNWGNMAISDFLKKFLPSFLELHLGATHSEDANIKKTISKFFESLTNAGLEKVDPAVGDVLDPEFHEVLMLGEGKAGTIVQVFEPGWTLNGRLLLPAKVSAAESN